MKNDLYVEISPRASGKTYRLIEHAFETLDNCGVTNVNIFASNNRIATRIKDQLIKRGGDESRIFLGEYGIPHCKSYYDDFDYLNWSPNSVLNKNGYYCTTLKKVRNLKEFDDTDFLFRLLKETKGKIISYSSSWLVGKEFYNSIITKDWNNYLHEYNGQIFNLE